MIPLFSASLTCTRVSNTVLLFQATDVLQVNYKTKWGPEEHSSKFSPLKSDNVESQAEHLSSESNQASSFTSSGCFFKDLLTCILRDISYKTLSWNNNSFWHLKKCKTLWKILTAFLWFWNVVPEDTFFFFFLASTGCWFTGQSDTINLRSKWHNRRLHKSYQHSQAPRHLLRRQFCGSPPERKVPISREWQAADAGEQVFLHWHASDSGWRIYLQKGSCNDFKMNSLNVYTDGLMPFMAREIATCLSFDGTCFITI